MGHTTSIHSRNDDVDPAVRLEEAGLRIVVNTPTTLRIIGLTTGLDPSMTLGCGGYGGNITSDNISPQHLLNIKRLAYETSPAPVRREVVTPSAALPRGPSGPKERGDRGRSAGPPHRRISRVPRVRRSGRPGRKGAPVEPSSPKESPAPSVPVTPEALRRRPCKNRPTLYAKTTSARRCARGAKSRLAITRLSLPPQGTSAKSIGFSCRPVGRADHNFAGYC